MNFQADVIQKSHERPVVVDFWAAWCGPCRFLGPVITEMAEEAAGSWELVKVNTEEEREIAQQFNIMSIPHVKMFSKGEVIAEFTGALPRGEIQKWLDAHLPSEAKEELNSILKDLQEDFDKGLSALRSFVQSHPEMVEAKLELASHVVFSDPALSLSLTESLKAFSPEAQKAQTTRTLAELMQFHTEDGKAPFDQLQKAQLALKEVNFENGIEQLIKAVQIDKTFAGDLPRRACIAMFQYLGQSHALTKKYRPHFNMALY